MYFDLSEVQKEKMFLNFIVSARGAGKTYSSLRDLVQAFIDNEEQFIYIRRTQSELDLCLPSLFGALINDGHFEDHTIMVKGENFYLDNKLMGRGIALSTAYKFKSVAFPKVKSLLFDEFISESKSYLKDECYKFLSLIETIGRMREIEVYCLANQDTIFNPYYVYFGVKPAGKDIVKTRFRSKSILIYQFNSSEYVEAKKKTRFGQLIKGTQYGGFMLDNEAIKDDYSFIEDLKGVKKTPFVNITINGSDLTAYDYEHDNRNYVFIMARAPVENIPSFNLDKQLREERTIDNVRRNPYLRRIKMYFDRGFIRFKDVPTKTLISEIIF